MWDDKHVAIAGFGAEGKSVLSFLKRAGVGRVTILDESNNIDNQAIGGVDVITGQNAFSDLSGFDVVFRSPGVNPNKLNHPNVTSSTKIFFSQNKAKIIGVTGSKGKGTTAALIHEMLKTSGLKAHLVGNIGVPALDVLESIQEQDVVVFELSSFQLWDLKSSPEIAVVLMVEPEHLDVHASIGDYISAKSNIAVYQSKEDFITYHPNNKFSQEIASKSVAKKAKYLTPQGAYIDGGIIKIEQQEIIKANNVKLIGAHNLENICAAVTAVWQITKDIRAIKTALTSFSGLKHRLEYVAEVGGVKYFNDSIGTTPASAVSAISAFDKPVLAIMGGSSKGVDYREMARKMTQLKNLKKVILIGETAGVISEDLRQAGFDQNNISNPESLKIAVHMAHDFASEGDIVVLAPASASFDMFDNYQDRGEQFIKIVKSL